MKTETKRAIEAVLRLPFFVIAWVLFLAVKIPTILLGVFVVPLLWKWRSVDYAKLPSWTRPWANPEDWHGGPQTFVNSLPEWWVEREGASFKTFWRYHAIRNPANGLRSFEVLDLDIDRELVRYVATDLLEYFEPWHMRKIAGMTTSAYICWQGGRAGVKVVHLWSANRHFVFKFGWRVHPNDAHRDVGSGIRQDDAGFATKLLPYRKG